MATPRFSSIIEQSSAGRTHAGGDARRHYRRRRDSL